MTLTLHLGVFEISYTDDEPVAKRVAKSRKGKQRPRGQASGATSQNTGDVAEILEEKYHIFETFYDLHEEEIAETLADSMAGSLETLLSGGPASPNPFAAAESDIQAMFKKYLESAEIEGTATPGVPTLAALHGVSHRLKHPYAKGNPRRPSFVDSGLLEASATIWLERS